MMGILNTINKSESNYELMLVSTIFIKIKFDFVAIT